ncbi:MAG: InlB B-repeat-containing protein [Clostridia bacterium]|nr:InlB B-repeat-containing protein [Clostridia bacterium]
MLRKRITAFFLALLLASLCVLSVPQSAMAGEEKEIARIEKNIQSIIQSLNHLKESFGPEDTSTLTQIFSGFMSAFSTIGSVVGPINGSIAFLKLIGLLKDGTAASLANITTQLNIIKEKIAQMDTKLDMITEQMQIMKASDDFNARTIKSMQMVSAWHAFESNYMENKMDELMRQYNVMVMDGLKAWVENRDDSARHGGNIDLDTVLLLYRCTNAPDTDYPGPLDELKFELDNVDANRFSTDKSTSYDYPDPYIIYADQMDTRFDKYVVLDKTFFPAKGEMYWNVNTFRDDLKNYIKNKIRGYFETKNFSHFQSWNYYEFNAYGDASLRTEELIDQTAEDALQQVIYRVISSKLNESADFSSKACTYFQEYCHQLTARQYGIDALLMSMYLTNSFEYEIKDDITAFLDQMAFKTGVYGVFAAHVAGMSKSVQDTDKANIMTNLCDAVEKITDAKNTAITNTDNYSYVTGTVLEYGETRFTASVTVDWRHRGSYYAYRSSDGGNFTTSVTDSSGSKVSGAPLIGDSNVVLLTYLLNASGQSLDHDFMNKHMSPSVNHDDFAGLITSLDGQQVMGEGTYLSLKTNNIIGDYFSGNPDIYLNSLPGDAEFGYFPVRNMMVGTLYEPAQIKLNVHTPLTGIAVYGEDHTFWVTDESAVMGNSRSNWFVSHRQDKQTDRDIISNVYYTTTYDIKTYFNCIISKPLVHSGLSSEEYNALDSFKEVLEELNGEGRTNNGGGHKHEWDEGVIRESEGEIPATITYTCKTDPAHVRTEYYPNHDMVTLTFDPNGGVFLGSTKPVAMEFESGKEIQLPGAPERDGYTFVFWDSSEYPADAAYLPTASRTFKAVWKEGESPVLPDESILPENTKVPINNSSGSGQSSRTIPNSLWILWSFLGCVGGAAILTGIILLIRKRKSL